MNQKERDIINYLRTNGKRPNISRVARELKLPISTVSERIKNIEKKYILKHSPLLDYKKAGYFANVFLAVKVDSKQRRPFLDFLKNQSCVNSIYCVNSSYNFLIEVVCKDSLDLVNWVDKFKKRFSAELTQFQVLKTEEKEKFVPIVGGQI